MNFLKSYSKHKSGEENFEEIEKMILKIVMKNRSEMNMNEFPTNIDDKYVRNKENLVKCLSVIEKLMIGLITRVGEIEDKEKVRTMVRSSFCLFDAFRKPNWKRKTNARSTRPRRSLLRRSRKETR